MQIQRLIKEQIYLVKRRGRNKTLRRSTASSASQKKIFGLICIMIGVLLVLTRCSKGNADKENTRIKQEVSISGNYYTYLQDFNINENTLIQLHSLALKNKKPYSDTLAIWTAESYKGTDENNILRLIKSKHRLNALSSHTIYEDMSSLYSQFIYDVACFPVAKKSSYTYENGWKEARNYKGVRQHYGIDIMDPSNFPGKIKIYSITDGVVENIGWNEAGGYRVGIRSKGGAYFYYAHLNENPTHINKGDTISAGDYIGDMGDTGYGEEGTRGVFPVHLHIGIAIKVKDNEEFWINPYYLLKYLELKDFVYKGI